TSAGERFRRRSQHRLRASQRGGTLSIYRKRVRLSLQPSLTLTFFPIFANSDVDDERNFKLKNPFHGFFYQGDDLFDLFVGDFKNEFVVDLQDHIAFEACGAERMVDI